MAEMQGSRRPARPMRLARKYSLWFLFVVLTGVCVWPKVSRYVREGCENSSVRLVSPNGARQLLNAPDQFTQEQRKHGAVLLHVLGLLYMFIGIAIVCDECFVPALEVISDVLNLSPNVAGATFMAAGGSAPEFCTSLMGAMVTTNDIGTGTIIGSAVFNVLFVIGVCAIVAKDPLQLTWFPLARDSIFYSVDLFALTVIFLDDKVMWYEALILFILYLTYITFMVYSDCIEAWATEKISRKAEPPSQAQQDKDNNHNQWAIARDKLGDLQDSPTSDIATAGTGDTGEAHSEKQRGRLVGIVTTSPSPKIFARADSTASVGADTKKHFKHHSLRASTTHGHLKGTENPPASTGGSPEEPEAFPELNLPEAVPEEDAISFPQGTSQHMELTNAVPLPADSPPQVHSPRTQHSPCIWEEDEDPKKEEDDEDDQPLSFFPPDDEDTTWKDWIYYVLTLPIVFLLVITIPDVRREGWRKLYMVTFVMSILWIVAFTWAMVWFARVIAETAEVGDHIMGLTILAAGTSVPDMLTSMIVAREGHGDMAISSSIGSNIFDVTVGMPIPWLLFAGVHRRPVRIVNEGLEISIIMLLGMLGVTIGTIMCHGWRMTRWMGVSMLFLYAVFVGVSIGLAIFTAHGGSLKLIHV